MCRSTVASCFLDGFFLDDFLSWESDDENWGTGLVDEEDAGLCAHEGEVLFGEFVLGLQMMFLPRVDIDIRWYVEYFSSGREVHGFFVKRFQLVPSYIQSPASCL